MTQIATKAGKKEWLGLCVIALPCLLYSMDLTVLNLAVPKLSVELKPTSVQLLWIVDIYGFMLAGMLIPMGTLGDRIGRRRLLMYGAAAFGAASVLAAFSRNAEMLIVSRAILGIAGATLAPSTLSLIRNMFANAEQRKFAIAVWITSFSAGGMVGPIAGGLILEHYHWSSAFLIGVPVMIVLLVSGPFLLPEYKDPEAGRIDLASATLSLLAVLLLILGIKLIVQHGFTVGATVSVLASTALAAVFVRRQRTLANPFLDLQLFAIRPFTVSLATYTLGTFVLFGMFFFVTQYLQLVHGLSPFVSGLWTLPSFGGFVIGSIMTPRLARFSRPTILMAFGLLVSALGFTCLAFIDKTDGPSLFFTGITLYSLGMAPVFTLATDSIVGSAPPEKAGIASSISETGSELGGALGIAILGSMGALVYRSSMGVVYSTAITPAQAKIAADTLAGALDQSASLDAMTRSNLLMLAKSSFMSGLHIVAVACALLTLATAIVLFMTMKDSRRSVNASH